MSRPRTVTTAVLGVRVVYAAALIAAPTRLGRGWLGPAADSAPTQVPLRALGAREVVLHAGALVVAVTGRPLRPWLLGSIAGDLTDIAATIAGRDQLPDGSARATVAVAGASVLLSAALAVALER